MIRPSAVRGVWTTIFFFLFARGQRIDSEEEEGMAVVTLKNVGEIARKRSEGARDGCDVVLLPDDDRLFESSRAKERETRERESAFFLR